MSQSKIKARLTLGSALMLLSNFVVRLLGLVTLVVLGRLLSPDDFGVIALALIVVTFSDLVMNNQFHMALVKLDDKEISNEYFNTAFTLSLGWGLIGALIVFSSSWGLVLFFEEERVGPATRALALLPILGGLRNPYFSDFERRLSFGPASLAQAVPRGVSSAVSIGLAIVLESYWALVLGRIALAFLHCATTYVFALRRPRLSLKRWRYFFDFGLWLSATGFMRFLQQRADAAVLGYFLSSAVLGIYQMGVQVSQLTTQQMVTALVKVLYPGLASIRDEKPRFRQAYYNAQSVIIGVMLPITVGIALVAEEAVELLLGARWRDSIPIIQILAPVMGLQALTGTAQSVAMVHGDTRKLFFRTSTVVAVNVPLLIAGAYHYGMIGVALARAVGVLLDLILTLIIAGKEIGDGAWRSFQAGARTFVACALMTVAVIAIDAFISPGETQKALATSLAMKASVGAITFCSAHLALWALAGKPHGFESYALSLIRSALQRVRRRATPAE